MEFFILCLIVLSLYFFIRLSTSVGGWWGGSRYRAYRHLANRFGGRFESRGISDPPTVSFFHQGSTIRVGLAPSIPGQPPNPRTRVVARFRRGIPFRLELAPSSRPAPAQPAKGTRGVLTGDGNFDHGHMVQANDPDIARDFLDFRVRAALLNLQRLVHPGGMLVSINPERLLVQIDRNLGQQTEALLRMVTESLVLHDTLLVGVSRRIAEGIKIDELSEPVQAAEAPSTCKVCGNPIESGPVLVCSSCRTPHHRECWEWVGACSIYGCGCKLAEPPGRPRV